MNRTVQVFLSTLFFVFSLSAQENFNFTVYYHWGPVWIKGGTMQLKQDVVEVESNTLVKLTGTGKSLPKWKWLFEIDDIYTSWCEKENYMPVKAQKNTFEGGYVSNNKYIFDYDNNKIYIQIQNSEKKFLYDTLAMEGTVYDAQSATAFLRFIDYDLYADVDTFSIVLLLDGELVNQKIVLKKNKMLKDKHGKEYKVIEFSALVDKNPLFSNEEAIKVWVSDDKKRIPLKIKAELFVGSVEILYDDIKFVKPG
jgi:hypothetical protein